MKDGGFDSFGIFLEDCDTNLEKYLENEGKNADFNMKIGLIIQILNGL